MKTPDSLRRYFRRQSVRWSLIGLGLTALFSIPCILYSEKIASERQLMMLAKSASRAFRPLILKQYTRDAELQIRNALDLKSGESVVVRSLDLKPVYPLNESDILPKCTQPMVVCWERTLRHISVLFPIYFDEGHENLYGYLELSIQPERDPTILTVFLVLLTAAFFAQALGLSSALNQSANRMIAVLSAWSDHLRNEPHVKLSESPAAPYLELEPMKEAVDGLYFEIAKLKDETARIAKAEGQLAFLREISHDLRTPHSLIANNFELHLDTLRSTGQANPIEVLRIHGALKRMGDLLRQVRLTPFGVYSSAGQEEKYCHLESETSGVLNDLRNHPDVVSKNISLRFELDDKPLPSAQISRIAYYRILENLVSNAAESIGANCGEITVSLRTVDCRPTLFVKDNGHGIPEDLRKKIFEFDFTTKFSRGTGLGLGIVAKICNEFNAEITFESAIGGGTEFKVTFQPVTTNVSVASPLEVTDVQA